MLSQEQALECPLQQRGTGAWADRELMWWEDAGLGSQCREASLEEQPFKPGREHTLLISALERQTQRHVAHLGCVARLLEHQRVENYS